jgi:hypothetical protein
MEAFNGRLEGVHEQLLRNSSFLVRLQQGARVFCDMRGTVKDSPFQKRTYLGLRYFLKVSICGLCKVLDLFLVWFLLHSLNVLPHSRLLLLSCRV